MTEYQFPQYAKSTHSDVLQTIRENETAYQEFMSNVRDFCEELTGNPLTGMLNGWKLDEVRMSGLHVNEVDPATLPGNWKKPSGVTIAPYRNNPVYDRMAALVHKAPSIPGRPRLLWGPGSMGTGAVFEHNDAVYSKLGFRPLPDRVNPADGAWIEIKASEFYAAAEAEEVLRLQAAAQ